MWRENPGEGTYGDWAVCEPPVGFFWGGTWVLGNKETKVPKSVGDILEWITLDATDDGLQYMWLMEHLMVQWNKRCSCFRCCYEEIRRYT